MKIILQVLLCVSIATQRPYSIQIHLLPVLIELYVINMCEVVCT